MIPEAEKDFKKLDKSVQRRIQKFIDNKVLRHKEPTSLAKILSGKLSGFYSYRVGDYRIVADIQDHVFIIMAIAIGHRKEVYNS